MNIVCILIVFLCIFTSFLSKRISGKWNNYITYMVVPWTIESIASLFGLFNFYIPRTITYIYILIMLFVFTITCIGFYFLFQRVIRKRQDEEMAINDKVLEIIFWGMIIFLIPVIIKVLPDFFAGKIKFIRNSFLSNSRVYFSYIQFYAYSYIIRPYFVALEVIASYACAKNQKGKNKILLYSILGSVIHILLTGGRKEAFNLIILIFIAFMIYGEGIKKHMKKFKKKYNNKFVIVSIFFLIAGIIYVCTQRLYQSMSLTETLWQYSVGPMSYLDIIINNQSHFGIERGNYLFGKATFGFITVPISVVIAFIFRTDYKGADFLLGIYHNDFYNVGSHIKLNATSTIIYPFLRDWGKVGIVLGAFLIGAVVTFIWIKAHCGNTLWKWLLLLVCFSEVFSVWRYSFAVSDFAFAWIWLVILYYITKMQKFIVIIKN